MALTIGKKLWGSYSLMLLITVVLGVIGYVLFSNISETVDELTGHNLPAVKGSVSVERTAFECILAEKNYVLYERDEIHKHAQERLVTLMGHLDTVDDVAEKYNDTVLGQDSKEVRKIAREVGELYEQAVQSLKDNKKLAALMDEKGNHVSQEADFYMATKKAEYMEAKHALSILNSINATALDTRMNEKAYMLYKDKKYFDAIEGNIAELLKAYDKLETMRPDEKERQQITVARKATKEYFEAAKAWVAEYEKSPDSTRLVRLAQTMNETGQIVGKQAADYQRAKAEKTDKIADAVFIVAGIAQKALKTRLNEKSYIITRSQRYWEGLNAHITKLDNLYDNLRKVSLTSEDFQRIDRVDKATGEYLAGAKSWVENDNTLHNKILPAMNKGSNEVLAIAQQAGDNGWKGADAMKEATLGVVGNARGVIVVALIVAILLGVGFAFVVSRIISQGIAYVVNNIKQVAEDAANGKLDSRADVEATGIDFKAIPVGFNYTLDAVVGPLNVAAKYVDRISKGDIPEKITDEYKGDFNEIKVNLNVLIDAMNEVIKVAQEIAIGNLMVKVEKRSEQDELMKALEEMVGATNEVIKVAQEIAIGNLMVKVEKRSEQDELMKALEQTVESLRGLVGQAQETAEKVSATSQELSSSAQEMNATTEEVSSTVQQIAASSTKQAEATETTSKVIEDISTTIKENASAAQAASAVAVEAIEKAQTGKNATQRTSEKIGQVNSVINEAVGFVRGLKDRSQQIGKIVDVITGFANQTNLLSLNAAIEAARAGESGRGFAVVAEEVRKLAEGSKKSAEEIADLIAEIQAETEKTVISIDSGSKEVTEGMEVVKETGVALEEIIKGVEEAGAMSRQVSSASQQMVEGIEKIVKAVEEISATAEENASAVQEVSASTEEQTASMEQMASSAQELSDMAIKLAELTAKFKVGGDKDVRR